MATEDKKPIGEILDRGGVLAALADDDLVVGAVACLKIVTADGQVVVRTAWTDGLDWVNRLGILDAAHCSERPGDSDIS